MENFKNYRYWKEQKKELHIMSSFKMFSKVVCFTECTIKLRLYEGKVEPFPSCDNSAADAFEHI